MDTPVLTVEGNEREIARWGEVIHHVCPDATYLDVVVRPWVEFIGPERNRQYGVLGLNELGVRGVLAQVLNCYYRWFTLQDANVPMDATLDVLRDGFGYAVLTGITYGSDPEHIGWYQWDWLSHSHRQPYESIRAVWFGHEKPTTTMVKNCFTLAAVMFNRSWSQRR